MDVKRIESNIGDERLLRLLKYEYLGVLSHRAALDDGVGRVDSTFIHESNWWYELCQKLAAELLAYRRMLDQEGAKVESSIFEKPTISAESKIFAVCGSCKTASQRVAVDHSGFVVCGICGNKLSLVAESSIS